MLHTLLTPTQQTQAARELFYADALVGLDPADFDYEVDGQGLVTGRRPLALEQGRRKQIRNQPIRLGKCRGLEPTPEQAFIYEAAINDLARAVALRLAAKSQPNAGGCAAETSSAAGAVPAAPRQVNQIGGSNG